MPILARHYYNRCQREELTCQASFTQIEDGGAVDEVVKLRPAVKRLTESIKIVAMQPKPPFFDYSRAEQ